jgi:uncharacterized membrane protein YkoI
MPSRNKSAAALIFSLGLLLSANGFAQNSEKPVKMKDLPAAVQATVRQQSIGATRRGLSKEVEGGKTFYEVELRVGGHNKDVLIDPTGAVVAIEEEVAPDSLPEAVKAEFEKHAAGGRVVMVESITENGQIVAYEAHIKTGKKSLEVKVAPDGRLIATETDADDEDGAGSKEGSQKPKRP